MQRSLLTSLLTCLMICPPELKVCGSREALRAVTLRSTKSKSGQTEQLTDKILPDSAAERSNRKFQGMVERTGAIYSCLQGRHLH